MDLNEWEWHLCMALQTAADRSGRARILIARDAGISQKHLSQVLLGQAAVSLTTASRIADACGHRLIIRVDQEGTT
jgi:DNA-binding phage protein